jgi:quercetin dioxygenase-like cupin family protein
MKQLVGILCLVVAAAAAAQVAPSKSEKSKVLYFDSKQVAASFQKAAVLLDNSNGRNYSIITGHREGPGMVEVHALDTDVIYVVEGTATVVTGGQVQGGKTTAPNEVRGASIQGGDVHHLSKGDMMVVPNTVPHWFREVPGTISYLVVKVR